MADVTKVFEEHNIIPDVLPSESKIPNNLGVHWPKVNLRAPGERLHRDDLQEQPTLTTNLKPDDADTNEYVLLMVDPDLTHYNDRTFGQVRHWMVPKVTITKDGEVVVNQAATISPYVGPAPLAAHLVVGEARPSRYTFLLLKHRTGTPPVAFDPESPKARYEGDPGQLGGEMQNIVDRMGFDTATFIQKNGLEVAAGTFVFVEGNVKSTLANAGLLATGVAQKAVGK